MTGLDWAPLTDGETVIWQGQPRWQVVLRGGLVGILVAAVIAIAGVGAIEYGVGPSRWVGVAAGLGSVGAVALPTGWVWLRRRATRYLLTDSALYHRRGVRRVTVTRLPLGKIQNTAYDQSVLGTLFDHGTVTIETAGSDGAELRLRSLNEPQSVHETLAETAGAHQLETTDDIPGSLSQWQAVRSEVQRLAGAVQTE